MKRSYVCGRVSLRVISLTGCLLFAACNPTERSRGESTPEPISVEKAMSGTETDGVPSNLRAEYGGVTVETVNGTGYGRSPNEAVLKAMQIAIAQVNGANLDSVTLSQRLMSDMSSSDGTGEAFNASSFSDEVVSLSSGQIKGFRILEVFERINSIDAAAQVSVNESWVATISADIAVYDNAVKNNLPRIVIAPLQAKQATYRLGDARLAAKDLQSIVHSSLRNRLSESDDFVLLDRKSAEIFASEAEFINSGRVNKTELTRVGQMLAADLILVPIINDMAYNKHSQSLQTSDRKLISYSGSMTVSFEILHAVTGEVRMNETYTTEFPSTKPTTLSKGLNGTGVATSALEKNIDDFFNKFLSSEAPLTVVQLSGNMAVLNEGEARLKPDMTFDAFILGDELFDPRTNVSLGRPELPIGSLKVNRVTEKLSYGSLTLFDGIDVSQSKAGDIILRAQ